MILHLALQWGWQNRNQKSELTKDTKDLMSWPCSKIWYTRAHLGRVAPLGQARSVYKSNVECIFLSRNDGQMTSIFNTNWEHPRMHVYCKFGDSSPNLWWVITQTSHISHNSESKWPKWPWRSRSMTSIFNTKQVYPRMHVWCKFGDSSPNLWWVIVRTSQIS